MTHSFDADRAERLRILARLWLVSPKAEDSEDLNEVYLRATRRAATRHLAAAVDHLIERGWFVYPHPPPPSDLVDLARQSAVAERRQLATDQRRREERAALASWAGVDLDAHRRRVLTALREGADKARADGRAGPLTPMLTRVAGDLVAESTEQARARLAERGALAEGRIGRALPERAGGER